MSKLTTAIVASAVLVAVVAIGLFVMSTHRSHDLTGMLTLTDSSPGRLATVGDGCQGAGPYNDLAPETSVTVKNETGTIVGHGSISGIGSKIDNATCTFAFAVPNVSASTFYSVTIGSRSPQTYSADQLNADGWRLKLAINNG